MNERATSSGRSRREFLVVAGATVAASALPSAQVAAPARYRRQNLSDAKASARSLDGYRKAVTAMLALPPSHPQNWYRNALIHTLDCPHGNWWFFPWHRGYLGWFEQTCRTLSGDPTFALPFWDWTAMTKVPDAFYDGILNPVTSSAYIASFDAFDKAFKNPMSAFWKTLSAKQLEMLKLRSMGDFTTFWNGLPDMFFAKANARGMTKGQAFDAGTAKAVSIDTVRSGLAPTDFINFGSAKAANHEGPPTGFAIIEGQPHNQVHNNVGNPQGFMLDFLSPVDPIFFMHHANIDRLWDVWTRKQQRNKQPTLPTGADLKPWQVEPFLFYVNADGKPVTAQATAGDYATIGQFNYDYASGSGDDVIPASPRTLPALRGTLQSKSVAPKQPGTASVQVPEATLKQAGTASGPTMYARVTIRPNADTPRGTRYHVMVNAPDGATASPESSAHAGSFELFGSAHHITGPVYFTVAISGVVSRQRTANTLQTAQPLRLQVHAEPRQGQTAAASELMAVDVTFF